MNIKEFRQQYPQYDTVDDFALAKALHAKFYPTVEFSDFSSRFIEPAYVDESRFVDPPDQAPPPVPGATEGPRGTDAAFLRPAGLDIAPATRALGVEQHTPQDIAAFGPVQDQPGHVPPPEMQANHTYGGEPYPPGPELPGDAPPSDKGGTNLALAPLAAVSALQGFYDPLAHLLVPWAELAEGLVGMEGKDGEVKHTTAVSDALQSSRVALEEAKNFWKQQLPEDQLRVGDIGVGMVDGKPTLRPFTKPLGDVVSETAGVAGFVAGPGKTVSTAGRVVVQKSLQKAAAEKFGVEASKVTPQMVDAIARPLYQAMGKGLVAGGLLPADTSGQRAENMLLFAALDGVPAALGSLVNGVKTTRAWANLTGQERALVVQNLQQMEKGLRANGLSDEAIWTILKDQAKQRPDIFEQMVQRSRGGAGDAQSTPAVATPQPPRPSPGPRPDTTFPAPSREGPTPDLRGKPPNQPPWLRPGFDKPTTPEVPPGAQGRSAEEITADFDRIKAQLDAGLAESERAVAEGKADLETTQFKPGAIARRERIVVPAEEGQEAPQSPQEAAQPETPPVAPEQPETPTEEAPASPPANFKAFAEGKGLWPISVTDPRYTAMKAEFDALKGLTVDPETGDPVAQEPVRTSDPEETPKADEDPRHGFRLEQTDVGDPVTDGADVAVTYDILDDNGKPIAWVVVEEVGDNLNVVEVAAYDSEGKGQRGAIGTAGMRKVRALLAKQYPKAEKIRGKRITGTHAGGAQNIPGERLSPEVAPEVERPLRDSPAVPPSPASEVGEVAPAEQPQPQETPVESEGADTSITTDNIWKMSRAEWARRVKAREEQGYIDEGLLPETIEKVQAIDDARRADPTAYKTDAHYLSAQGALRAGLPVPREVLEDYSKLGEQWASDELNRRHPERRGKQTVLPKAKEEPAKRLPNRMIVMRDLKHRYGLTLEQAKAELVALEAGETTQEELAAKYATPVEPAGESAPEAVATARQDVGERGPDPQRGKWYEGDEARKEAIFKIMRDLRAESTGKLQKARELAPRGGEVAVGSADYDEFVQGDAIANVLGALGDGATPQEAGEIAKARARKSVEKHNAQRPRDFAWQRDEGTADARIETAVRRLVAAGQETPTKAPQPPKPQAPNPADQLKTYQSMAGPSQKKVLKRWGYASEAALYEAAGQEAPGTEATPATPDNKQARKFRDMTKALQAKIDQLRAPRETNTRKRQQQAEQAANDADDMQKRLAALNALADAHEAGTVPESLQTVTTGRLVNELLFREKPPVPKVYAKDVMKALEALKGKNGVAALRSQLSEIPHRVRGSDQRWVALENTVEVKAIEHLEKMLKALRPPVTGLDLKSYDWAEAKQAMKARIEDWKQSRDDLYKLMEGKRTGRTDEEKRADELERTLATRKSPGFFQTPKAIAERMVKEAGIEEGDRVLEPSAGGGRIAEAIRSAGTNPEVTEIAPDLRQMLLNKGFTVLPESDFLRFQEGEDTYDKILMNPPFEKGQDIDHVRHAFDLLKPGGRIVAIMSEGPFFRNDKKATGFREWLEDQGGTSEKLPKGAFKESGTGVASRLVVIDKPEAEAEKPTEGFRPAIAPKPEHVNRETATAAHAGTSMVPEKRAQQRMDEYVQHMEAVWKEQAKRAETPEQQAILRNEFETYRQNWLKKYHEHLRAQSRVMSAMITGPSKFPTRSNRKKSDAADKRLREFLEWDQRAQRAMKKKVAPLNSAISSDNADAPSLLRQKIAKAEELQAKMKAGNKIARSKKLSDDEKIEKLVDLGLSKAMAKEALTPDYGGRLGFPAYELTNNNANIKRMKARLIELEARRSEETAEFTFNGGTATDSVEDNRLQLFFEEKPAPEVRAKLKSNGFRWAPSAGAWQRMRGPQAIRAAERAVGTLTNVEESPAEDAETVAFVPETPEEAPSQPVDEVQSPEEEDDAFAIDPTGTRQLKAEQDAAIKANVAAAGESATVRFSAPGRSDIVLHKSTRVPGKWQTTYIQEGQPTGHNEFVDREQAILSISGKFADHTGKGNTEPPVGATTYRVVGAEEPKEAKPAEVPEAEAAAEESLRKSPAVEVTDPPKDETPKQEEKRLEKLDRESVARTLSFDAKAIATQQRKLQSATRVSPTRAKGLMRAFVQATPEFKGTPVFTVVDVSKSGNSSNLRLQFTDSYRFRFYPDVFGLDVQDLKVGEHIEVDLPSWTRGKVTDGVPKGLQKEKAKYGVRKLDKSTSGSKWQLYHVESGENFILPEVQVDRGHGRKHTYKGNLFKTKKEAVEALRVYANQQDAKMLGRHGPGIDLKPPGARKTPTGTASTGGFTASEGSPAGIDVETPTATQIEVGAPGQNFPDTVKLETINVVEMPEMVEIIEDLGNGKIRAKVLEKMRGSAVGRFKYLEGVPDSAHILMQADLWHDDPKQAAWVLAHEIGHWVDALPDAYLKRGNILGRLATLKGFLKTTISALPTSPTEFLTPKDRKRLRGKAKLEAGKMASKEEVAAIYHELVAEEINDRDLVTRQEVMEELKELTQTIKPFDPEQDANYTKYRYSGKELYADAFSTLINDPALLKANAPVFFRSLLSYMERKPQVKALYDEIQHRLHDPSEVAARRYEKTLQDFQDAEQERAIEAEKSNKKESLWPIIRDGIHDRFSSIIEAERAAAKAGKPFGPEDSMILGWEEAAYKDSYVRAYLGQLKHDILKPLEELGVTKEHLGIVLKNDRIIFERHSKANPRGFDPKAARIELRELESRIGKSQYQKLLGLADKFREIRTATVTEFLREAGLFSPELEEYITNNAHYSTFQVIDYINKSIGTTAGQATTKLFRQVGTLKGVENPLISTVIRDIALVRGAHINKAIRDTAKGLERLDGAVMPAEKTWNGTAQVPDPHQAPDGYKMVTYRDKGKIVGVYVPKRIANAMESAPSEAAIVSRILGNNLFKEIFVGANPGFWTFNIARDLVRGAKNLPGATPAEKWLPYWAGAKFFGEWLRSLPEALLDEMGVPQDVIEGLYANHELISMESRSGLESEEESIERLLVNHGLGATTKQDHFWKHPARLYKMWTKIGSALDKSTKIAGHRFLKKRQERLQLHDRQLAHNVRVRVGSPDFLRGGKWKPFYNNIFLFSNPMKEGWRGDIEVMTQGNRARRAEVAWKIAQYNILPKLIMMAAAMGLLGGDKKDEYENVSEYNMTNYVVIPLGKTPSGKTVMLRIPTDETGRVFGGLVWKMLQSRKGELFTGLFDYMAGQAPTLAPLLSLMVDAVEYASGRNPYDSFRDRRAIPESLWDSRDADDPQARSDVRKAFLSYLWNKAGGHIAYSFRNERVEGIKTDLETFLDIPFSSNIVGRWIQVSDYGLTEKVRKERDKARANATNLRRQINKTVISTLNETNKKGLAATAEVLEALDDNGLLGQALDSYDKRAKVRAIKTKVEQYATGKLEGRPGIYIETLVRESNNKVKAAILSNAQDRLTNDEFLTVVGYLVRQGELTPALAREFGKVMREERP